MEWSDWKQAGQGLVVAAAGEQSCQGPEFRKADSPDILWSNNYKSLSGFLESVHDVHDAVGRREED